MEEYECVDNDRIIEDVKQFGRAVMLIEATDYLPSFAYTVGLWENYKHAELIAFGLTTKTLHAILNIGREIIKCGNSLEGDKVYDDFFEGGDSQFLLVDKNNLHDYFSNAIRFNQTSDFPALQLVWTDRKGKFPWETGFEEEFVYRQPMLDRNADFKFREPKNLGVFTTKQWLNEKKSILKVVHDEDGDWQFLTGDQLQKDLRIVCLKELVLRDQTLNNIFNLDYNETAERKFVGDKWVRNSINLEE